MDSDTAPSHAAAQAALLEARLLGDCLLRYRGRPISATGFSRRRALTLLLYLLATPGRRVARDAAVELLWPGEDPARSAGRLSAVISAVRAALGAGVGGGSPIVARDAVVGLHADLAVRTDVDAFEAAARRALRSGDLADLRAAAASYGGPFLPTRAYEDWVLRRRAELSRLHERVLAALAAAEAPTDPAAAGTHLRALLAADPTDEAAARALMDILARGGQRPEAVRVYNRLATALRADLGLVPAPETQALRRQLLAVADDPPVPERPELRSNLPAALTGFVGREAELAELRALLVPRNGPAAARERRCRLLTLTGAGGCGKTRLALELAAELLDLPPEQGYPDGVWLVELAAIGGSQPVIPAIAAALGLREEAGRPLLETLIAYLQPRQLLLLLDNCEHLAAECAAAATALLRSCPRLQTLATSRQVLGAPGETAWRVPSLPLPEQRERTTLAALSRCPAVQLLLQRARAHRPGFGLTEANAAAVTQVCLRLDGIPLALELVAPRLTTLSIETIAARLTDRFALLTGGSGVLPRHQTLRATMDWSHALLGKAEQVLFRRLAIFAGGWGLEALEAVCAEAGRADSGVLDLLMALEAKSLLLVEHAPRGRAVSWSPTRRGGEPRYRLLETVRQYAHLHLDEGGETAWMRARHLGYYLALAERAEPSLVGGDQEQWLDLLDVEHDNLRAALAWSLVAPDGAEAGVRLAAALWRFWEVRGYLGEGRRWLERALARGEGVAPMIRAAALNGAGNLARKQGDYRRAATAYEEALALRRAAGDRRGEALLLNNLGYTAQERGEYARATDHFEASLALAGALGHSWSRAASLNGLGVVAWAQGDYARAVIYYEQSLALWREVGHTQGIAMALNNLGILLVRQQQHERARPLHEESLALSVELGDAEGITCDLEGLAGVARAAGELERAIRLYGAAQALREAIGAELPPTDRAATDAHLATLRSARGEATYAALWQEGFAMSQEQAVAFALQRKAS